MLSLYAPALVVGFLITLLELTEVVALVFALSADQTSARAGAAGAVTGTAVVAGLALGLGAALIALPRTALLWASAVVLAGFGCFLLRSTVRTYRRHGRVRETAPAASSPGRTNSTLFAGGFSIGVVEALEAVIVLLALAAAGYGLSALVGAVAAAVLLVGVAAFVHERIRRIKLPWLKLGATSLLFTFAIFWAGEALGVKWPGADLVLLPLFVVVLLVLRGGIGLRLSTGLPVDTKG